MNSDDSVTDWINQVQDGDSRAATLIWARYVKRLVARARHKLVGSNNRVADEDDVVALAFAKFLKEVRNDNFERLVDRTDLWAILAMLVDHAATDQRRHYSAMKRGGGEVRGDSALEHLDSLERGAADKITPEKVVAGENQIAHLFKLLDSEELELISIYRLEGWENKEIAKQLGISLRGVERKLKLIRSIWQKELAG